MPTGALRRAGPAVAFAVAAIAWLQAAGGAEAGLNAWTSGGPPEQTILTLAVDPLIPGTVYAGSSGNGVFKSVDGGASWQPSSAGLTNPLVTALAIDPVETSTIYAGTTGGGVFKSLDGGASWAGTGKGLDNTLVTALAIHPTVPSILFAGTSGGGIFKSNNGGASWRPFNLGLLNTVVSAIVIDPQTPGRMYAGTVGGGVFKSLDGGLQWATANTGIVNTLVTAIAVDPLFPVNVYVGTTGGGIFRSTDAGRSWTPASTGLTNAVVTELALDPRTPNVLYAGTTGGGVFRSADAARNWTAFDTGLSNTSVAALAVTSGGACVHAGTVGRGVFDFAFTPGGCAPLPVQAAVLPSSRSVQVGAPATAFATIINTAPLALAGCRIAPLAALPASFLYQTTDPATNQPVGTPNTPASIAAGGLQTFLISFTPTAAIAPTDVRFDFSCLGAASAPLIAGVNTLLLSASPGPVPDIVALVAADGGVVALPGPGGSGSFAVAGIDVGAAATISVTADTGSAFVPVSLLLCETDPSTGACQGGPADSVSHAFGAGATATFGVFVTAFGAVADDPAVNRVFVRFTDADGATRGSTSVAVRTQ